MPATMMPTSPYTFNTSVLELYLQRIRYADNATPTASMHPRLEQLRGSMEDDSLTALTELERQHLAAITWGNTVSHYSNHHSISIHPACVFEKLVVRCLDGYCMENTNLHYMVLCSVGNQVYATGNRIDVGLGHDIPTSPLWLQENITAPLIAPSEMSLIRAPLAEFIDQTQKVWVYQARKDPHSMCIPQYSFSEMKFLFEDFNTIKLFTRKSRAILFTQRLAFTWG